MALRPHHLGTGIPEKNIHREVHNRRWDLSVCVQKSALEGTISRGGGRRRNFFLLKPFFYCKYLGLVHVRMKYVFIIFSIA